MWDSRDADEGGVAPVEEGAVEHLQDEGEVLQGQQGRGGTQGEQKALQRRQEQREHGRTQVRLVLTLAWNTHTHTHTYTHTHTPGH